MNKVYKYVLITLIVFATGFLTYQHYTDPIYQLKIGTTLNYDDKKIEDWTGRIEYKEDIVFIGYRTRLERGTQVYMHILNEDTGLPDLTFDTSVSSDYDFYYIQFDPSEFSPGHYSVSIILDEEVIETASFIIEELQ